MRGVICVRNIDKAALKEAVLINVVVCSLAACEVGIAIAWSSLIAIIVAIIVAIVSGIIFWYFRGGIALILGTSTFNYAVLFIGANCISNVSGLSFNALTIVAVIIAFTMQMAASSGYIRGEI